MPSLAIIVVLVLYLILLLIIGAWGGRDSRSVAQYYLAGKKLPSWVIAFSTNATGESAWLLLGLTGPLLAETQLIEGLSTGRKAFNIILGVGAVDRNELFGDPTVPGSLNIGWNDETSISVQSHGRTARGDGAVG